MKAFIKYLVMVGYVIFHHEEFWDVQLVHLDIRDFDYVKTEFRKTAKFTDW